MLNIYMNSSDIKSQINTVTVILKRDLRCMIYIDIDETFIVYMTELQGLIMTISIINTVKMTKLKL